MQKLTKVLKDLGCKDCELSVLLTGDRHIAELNQRYLKRKGPTNVLAFPMSGGPPPLVETNLLGDVVVSVERAVDESNESGESLEETLFRLLIHGILHLLGYDHEKSPEDATLMFKEEERLLALIKEM
ncbi:MAG: rRNA maturation RNase YbeY [Deltaproteobacteria bacterium]|nr:rRNA maturation RNase YbeY [Deltaproteobacteria bacterium]MBW1936139.1 rRNA maturation RNase YbeY [Deltaproteobacteria bacterium]MBW1978318.1 rRNA maturation RNase YbeY [Deltaproteobacteria bacterium]MBW2044612.1 rRNA maturation RNase YbeY [Deltaproteobacteria bacterium]MBW2300667.1 rRNA maturation RNase YbeY [Deltaproteobacteria bacterium]